MKSRIYLDYAASTPVDPRVLQAMKPFFVEAFGNPGSLHSFGQASSRALFVSRKRVANAIGAESREIVFTSSATEANNLALRGAVKAWITSHITNSRLPTNSHFQISKSETGGIRPRMVVSAVEHESVLETARDLEALGVEVVVLPVSREGFVDFAALQRALNERTLLVSVMYANNEVGTIQPIAEIAEIIQEFKARRFFLPKPSQPREHGPRLGVVARRGQASESLDERSGLREENFSPLYPLFHTDAAQALPYLDCGVNQLGVDFMTLSSHKLCGPKGGGALYVRKNQKSKIKNQHVGSDVVASIITGGGQEDGLRSGTENVPALVGFSRAVEVAVHARGAEVRRVATLRDLLFQEIRRAWPGVQLNGPPLSRARLPNNLNLFFPGGGAQEFLVRLDLLGVAASAGSACAARLTEPSYVLRAMGLSEARTKGSIRFTLGRWTTRREIVAVAKVIYNIRKQWHQ